MTARRRRRPVEPGLWLMFSGGGAASATVFPVLVLLFGIAFPLGWIEPTPYDRLWFLIQHPLTRLALFGLFMLSFFHWAHRFKYTLYDGLQVKHLNELVNTFCYGGALVGTLVAGWILWRL